jgi:hypothetical protein
VVQVVVGVVTAEVLVLLEQQVKVLLAVAVLVVQVAVLGLQVMMALLATVLLVVLEQMHIHLGFP